eukprot:gene24764-29925_t
MLSWLLGRRPEDTTPQPNSPRRKDKRFNCWPRRHHDTPSQTPQLNSPPHPTRRDKWFNCLPGRPQNTPSPTPQLYTPPPLPTSPPDAPKRLVMDRGDPPVSGGEISPKEDFCSPTNQPQHDEQQHKEAHNDAAPSEEEKNTCIPSPQPPSTMENTAELKTELPPSAKPPSIEPTTEPSATKNPPNESSQSIDPNLVHWANTRLPNIGLVDVLTRAGVYTVEQLLGADAATIEDILSMLKALPKRKFVPNLDDLKEVRAKVSPSQPAVAAPRPKKSSAKAELDEEEKRILREAIDNLSFYEAEEQYTYAELSVGVDRETDFVSHLNSLYCDAEELKITAGAMSVLLKSKEEHQSRANRLLTLLAKKSPTDDAAAASASSADIDDIDFSVTTKNRVRFNPNIERVHIDFSEAGSPSAYVVKYISTSGSTQDNTESSGKTDARRRTQQSPGSSPWKVVRVEDKDDSKE